MNINKKRLICISVGVIVVILAVMTVVWVVDDLTKKADRQHDNHSHEPVDNSETNSADTEAALKEAEEFNPEQMCTAVLTQARHITSGATYTFPSGCIPDGWERLPASSVDR